MDVDFGSITLTGLAIIGAVNVATMFYPNLTSQKKFALSVIVALGIGFIPPDLGSEIRNRIVEAILAAFAASGSYKLIQKLGPQPEQVILNELPKGLPTRRSNQL